MDLAQLILHTDTPYPTYLEENREKFVEVINNPPPSSSIILSKINEALLWLCGVPLPGLIMLYTCITVFLIPVPAISVFEFVAFWMLGFDYLPRRIYPLLESSIALTDTSFGRLLHIVLCNPLHALAPSDRRFWGSNPILVLVCALLALLMPTPHLRAMFVGFMGNVMWSGLMHTAFHNHLMDASVMRWLKRAEHLHPPHFCRCVFNASTTREHQE